MPRPIITLTHPDTVSGLSILDDGSKVYWTEGWARTMIIINPHGQQTEVSNDVAVPGLPELPGTAPMRPMTPAEVREYDSVKNRGSRELVVMCHAIHGDGTINCYAGPDTPEIRNAIKELDEKHGPGMFEIGDGICHCDTDQELLETLGWWGRGATNDCPDCGCDPCECDEFAAERDWRAPQG